MDSNDPHLRLGDRNAELIAAARLQFQQTPGAGSSAQGTSAPRNFVHEFQNYEVVRELHRGGQGVVYLAWQKGTRRSVAIKMVREGPFASPGERARFQREIEILGTLQHPNIITIHDSGIIAGSSYYIMDYVDGPPLDDYIRPLRDRSSSSASRADRRQFVHATLCLFAKICDAVQVAHLRGVIHRDLKPGNIRVDSVGEPRVLDFGLAKTSLAAAGSSAPASLTQTGQFLGTLAYASPEQAEGAADEVDVRTDVYALGVMLYELLSGRLPYPVTGKLPDVLNNIRHTEPARPATHREFRGDLDTILLKCLSKDKDRRYQAAGELAADIRRYLEGRPIHARRDSAIYVLRMFARRHRVAALISIAFVGLLGISSITLAYMYSRQTQLRELAEANGQRARENEALAVRREAETRQVAEFQAAQLAGVDVRRMGAGLRLDLLDSAAAAARASGADADAVAQQLADADRILAAINFTDLARHALQENVFERALEAINLQFDQQPLVQAGLFQTLADTMRAIGLFEQAMCPQTRALEIRRAEFGPDHPDTLTSTCNMGLLLEAMGRLDDAAPYYREALDSRRLILGDDHPDTAASVNNMGSLLHRFGRYDEALPYCREAVDANRRILGHDHPDTLNSMNNLAFLLKSMSRYDEAATLFHEALDARRRVLGNDHAQTLNMINSMGSLYAARGQLEVARGYYEEALAGRRRALGDMHPQTLESFNGMGTLLQQMARYDDAETHFRHALEGQRQTLGNDHPETLITINNIGHLLHSTGRLDEALPYYQEALDTFRRTRGPEHPNTLTLLGNMASLLKMSGRLDEAAPYHHESLEIARRVMGNEHPTTLNAMLRMGSLLQSEGRLDEAMALYREALDTSRRVLPREHVLTIASIAYMGSLLEAFSQLDEALRHWDEVLAIRRRVLGDTHPDTLIAINRSGTLLRRLGRLPEAELHLLEAASGAAALPPEHTLHTQVAQSLADLYEAWHALDPQAGHDQHAAQWRSRLD